MRKVKIFVDTNTEILERRINEWLKTHSGISVTDILQSESDTDKRESWSITVTIFYIEG